MTSKTKKVGFFRAVVLADGVRRSVEPDWRELLEPVAELSRDMLTHDGATVYDIQLAAEALPVVGVHQVLNPAFMSRLGERGITDLMDEAGREQEGDLAYSTAIAFLPVGGVVAVVTGTNQSPKPPKVVTEFLERHLPQPAGAHWATDPVMDLAKITRLREEANGVADFSTRMTTVRTLFAPDDETGLQRYMAQVAERLGADIEVELSIKLAPEARSRNAYQRLRDVVLETLPRVVGNPKSKAVATAVFQDGSDDVMESLNLVAHRLTAEFEVDPSAAESLRFTRLVEELRDVGGGMQDRLKELLEG